MRKYWSFLFVVIILLLASGCQKSSPATLLPGGSLQGVIVEQGSKTPIVGAHVSIAGQVGVFTVTTDEQGKYSAANLPPGAYLVSVQAVGYYVNIAQVGVASGIMSQADIALEAGEAVIAQVAPTALPPTPEAIPTLAPSVHITPTFKRFQLNTPTPTSAPTPTPRPAAAPAPTRCPAPPNPNPPGQYWHTAPILLEPEDESVFVGPQRILFRWTGVCCLAEDEYFVISIAHAQGVEEAWVKGDAWRAPLYLYLLVPESRRLPWNVTIRRHTGEYSNGQWRGPIVSPVSQTWHIVWLAGDNFISPLQPPTSPLSLPLP